MMILLRWLSWFSFSIICWGNGLAGDPDRLPMAVDRPVDFRKDVYPILENHCFACHSGKDAKSGIRLDVRTELLNGDEAPIQDKKSATSPLIHLVAGLDPDRLMPPKQKGKPLSTEQVGILRAWIDQGLAWDDTLLPPPGSEKKHWAFQPIQRPSLPKVQQKEWVRNPVDAFILARLEKEQLQPTSQADRRTQIRRLTLDLHGLPPTPAEVDAFLEDSSTDAYEKLVDRLLASPRYGEHWGRHWLDLARWAESDAYEHNYVRPHAWRYRDYVIRSFNEDKPFDLFIRQQIAGDELLPYSDENLIATGFLGASRYCSNEEDKAVQRNDILVDITNTTALAFLGLTMNCAQCHDHKFDPLSQKDYYRLHGYFVRGQIGNVVLKDPQLWKQYQAQYPKSYAPAMQLKESLLEIVKTKQADQAKQMNEEQLSKLLNTEDKKLFDALNKKIDQLKKQLPDKPQTVGFYSPVTSPTNVEYLTLRGDFPLPYSVETLKKTQPRLLARGDAHQPKEPLQPGWPELFGPTTGKGTRTELADWLTSANNPLTARVWANRVWYYHFGRGLCNTVGDVGLRGAKPTHPELLDWLACELREHKWSTKHLHRQIVLSATYQQAAKANDSTRSKDPQGQLYSFWKPRRLSSEAIRDSILFVNGELDLTTYGPSVELKPIAEYSNDLPEESGQVLRRSIYLRQVRDRMPPIQTVFDGPTGNESCPARHVSTVPLQPLFLLNSPFMQARAKALAQRLHQEAGADTTKQIETGFRLALGRKPDKREQQTIQTWFVENKDRNQARLELAQVLFNLNEFIYVD